VVDVEFALPGSLAVLPGYGPLPFGMSAMPETPSSEQTKEIATGMSKPFLYLHVFFPHLAGSPSTRHTAEPP